MFSFSAVLPTFNRVDALRETMPSFLALDSLGELIIVDDGSDDATSDFLAGLNSPLLRIVRHEQNMGSAVARMRGIALATHDWVLMLEDDCFVPKDYAIRLYDAAQASGADIAGAPWVHSAASSLDETVAIRRANPEPIGLRTHPGVFPSCDTITPFMPALVLMRRELFAELGYDRRFRGNAWREETSMFLSAVEHGRKCVLTPSTYSFQLRIFPGGQHGNRLTYELWVIYNNWRFLWRHRRILSRDKYVSSLAAEQLRFVVSRLPGASRWTHGR